MFESNPFDKRVDSCILNRIQCHNSSPLHDVGVFCFVFYVSKHQILRPSITEQDKAWRSYVYEIRMGFFIHYFPDTTSFPFLLLIHFWKAHGTVVLTSRQSDSCSKIRFTESLRHSFHSSFISLSSVPEIDEWQIVFRIWCVLSHFSLSRKSSYLVLKWMFLMDAPKCPKLLTHFLKFISTQNLKLLARRLNKKTFRCLFYR